MAKMIRFVYGCATLCFLLSAWTFSDVGAKRTGHRVSQEVAKLVVPILDEQQKVLEGRGDEELLGRLMVDLVSNSTKESDEALAVLMCFYIGESQEESDALIRRGRRVSKFLSIYRTRTPIIPNRTYPERMFLDSKTRQQRMDGVLRAIREGWKSTADNPVGD